MAENGKNGPPAGGGNNTDNKDLPLVSSKPKYKFLFVGWEALSGDLAWKIKNEGHEVKCYIKNCTDEYDGFLEKVPEWKPLVDWSDVVIFDDVGFGKEADTLRKSGKAVVGGSIYTDRLEEDREFGQSELKRLGMLTLPSWDFDDYDKALQFIKENPGRYVYKPTTFTSVNLFSSGDLKKGLLFTGKEEDGKDLYEIIEQNKKVLSRKVKQFQLQKHVNGVEVGASAFFNGEKFITPILIAFEHKRLFPGELGSMTGEMGTSMFWCEPNKLFKETTGKMEEDLRKSGYVGYIDINCMVNGRGIYPLEFTCFSEDTEILTKDGWKLIKNIRPKEKVATLDPKSHHLEYQSVTGFISKKHSGELIHVGGSGTSHQALDCLVTPNHQMYIQKRNGKFDFVNADSIPQGSKIKRTAKWKGEDAKTYSVPGYVENHYLGKHKKIHPIEHPEVKMPMSAWLKFLGIYLAEGSIGGKNHIVNVSQFNRKKEVQTLLKDFPFKVVENKKGFQISSTQLVKHLLFHDFGKSNTKYIPEYVKTLPPEQIRVFLDAFRIGDGTIHKRTGQTSYFSTSKKLIDDIQELLFKRGIVGNIREVKSKGTKSIGGYTRNSNIYFIAERTQKTDYYIDKRNISKVPYNGQVYCVEVPNHIIYVRRNGKAFWCGNCRFGYPTISIQQEGILSEWGEFLHAIANHQDYPLRTKKGFQIGVVCVVPPFPYHDSIQMEIYKDLSMLFKKPYLEGVHLGDVKIIDGVWRVAGDSAYVLVITGGGSTMEEARKQAYLRIENIILINMFYRTDIGTAWGEESDKLMTWGYI
ncbi:MAG TPA: LAGLIDADG family homing endonuclease [Candidatus Paceibacterota bacterium]